MGSVIREQSANVQSVERALPTQGACLSALAHALVHQYLTRTDIRVELWLVAF